MPFTFDFDSVYDRLNPDTVLEALEDAIISCREDWSEGFTHWIINLVKLSIESAFGEFKGKYYKSKGGIPTGGSISVELANIAVYFILKKVLFDDKKLMKDVVDKSSFEKLQLV